MKSKNQIKDIIIIGIAALMIPMIVFKKIKEFVSIFILGTIASGYWLHKKRKDKQNEFLQSRTNKKLKR